MGQGDKVASFVEIYHLATALPALAHFNDACLTFVKATSNK